MTSIINRLAPALRAGALSLAVAPLALAPAAGLAQQTQSQGQAQAEAPAPQDFSDEQLQAFADAMVDVQQIVREAQPKIEAAKGEQAKQDLRRTAGEDMVEAVQDSGLSVDTYNAIARTARDNPELARRITDMVEQSGSEG
jgi:hypothetical protein